MKLKKIKETPYLDTYIIDENFITINGIEIDLTLKNSYSTLSHYLKKVGLTLNNYIINEISGDVCIHCGKKINKSNFSRRKFKNYKFCDTCNTRLIKRLYVIKECIICNKKIFYKDVKFSTCGDKECLIKHRININNNIKKTHWTNKNKNNIESIIKTRSETRKTNDELFNRVYVAWNKGKTGIYSKETIEKLRNAAIKQMKEGRIKKTGQEKIFENFLIKNEIKYTYSFIYKRRQYDFLLQDYNLVIELQGDYWHGNPLFWDVYNNDSNKKKLYETQIMKKKDDVIKKQIMKDSKYDFIEFWENDIHNNFSYIIKTLTTKHNIIIKNNDDE